MSLASLMDLIDGPISGLQALQCSCDVIVNPIDVVESDRIENDNGHRDQPALISDSFACEPFPPASLHIFRIERHAGLSSIAPVKTRLQLSLEPVEISLIGTECLDRLLGGKGDGSFLDLMAQELVKRHDLAGRVRGHRLEFLKPPSPIIRALIIAYLLIPDQIG
jgi:hypothetical protein